MANNFHSDDKFRRPEQFFAEIMRKGIQGRFHEKDQSVPVLHRALVLAIDVIGGKLQNPDGNGSVDHETSAGKTFTTKAIIGPINPKNSVKARILSDGFDQFLGDSNLRVFWPFFPEHMSVPIKPGEHVYIIFEDANYEHGLWLSKVPGHEGMNFFPGQSSYETYDADTLSNKFPDTSNASEKKFVTDEEAGESGIKDGRLKDLYDDLKGG